MEYFTSIVEALQAGGAWAIVALLVIALGFTARAYVKVREGFDQYKDNLLGEMKDMLTQSITSSFQQAETNERVARALEARNVR